MFSNIRETVCTEQCSTSIVLTNFLKIIFLIDLFEKKCVIIKYILKSEKLKTHVSNIVVYQSLINSVFYEHQFMVNINKLY